MAIKYLSVCSGIEAATVAWHELGWEPVAFSEIEPFPCKVLAHHYPNTPNWGDMTKFKEWPDATIDALVGGTPCQSFSVAGLRQGLEDPRGELMLTYLAIAARYRPRWVVWENVPGVLSSNGGRDFGAFLGALGQLGYGWAYRVLDAQWFGVAQRRRRVFVVGCLGDWERAAKVLFESESVRRDPPSRRGKEKDVAGTLAAGSFCGGASGRPEGAAGNHFVPAVAGSLDTECGGGKLTHQSAANGHIVALQDVRAVNKAQNGRGWNDDGSAYTVDTHATQGVCVPATFDAQSGGDCRGLDLKPLPNLQANQIPAVMQPVAFESQPLYDKGIRQGDDYASAQETNAGALLRALQNSIGEEAFTQWGLGILNSLQSPEVLQQALHGLCIRPATFSRRWVVYCSLSREKSRAEGVLQSLREAECERCSPQGWEPSQQYLDELGAYLSRLSQPGAQATRFLHDLWQAAKGTGVLQQALLAIQNMGRSVSVQAESAQPVMQVRRLTPEEAEFLQGFSRGYTNIPGAKDDPRYKALGNSMAVPCMAWIGARICS